MDSAKATGSKGPEYLKICQRVFSLGHSGLVLGNHLLLLLLLLLLLRLLLRLLLLMLMLLLLLILVLVLCLLLFWPSHVGCRGLVTRSAAVCRRKWEPFPSRLLMGLGPAVMLRRMDEIRYAWEVLLRLGSRRWGGLRWRELLLDGQVVIHWLLVLCRLGSAVL